MKIKIEDLVKTVQEAHGPEVTYLVVAATSYLHDVLVDDTPERQQLLKVFGTYLEECRSHVIFGTDQDG